jgi:hypothetical protein
MEVLHFLRRSPALYPGIAAAGQAGTRPGIRKYLAVHKLPQSPSFATMENEICVYNAMKLSHPD